MSRDSREALKLSDPLLSSSLLSSLRYIKLTEARGSRCLNKPSYCVLAADQIREVMNQFHSFTDATGYGYGTSDISPSSHAVFLFMQEGIEVVLYYIVATKVSQCLNFDHECAENK